MDMPIRVIILIILGIIALLVGIFIIQVGIQPGIEKVIESFKIPIE